MSRRLFCISNPNSGVNKPVYSWFLDLPLHISTRLSYFFAKLMIYLYCHDFNLKWLDIMTSLIAVSIIDETEEDQRCVANDTFILDNPSLVKYVSLNLVYISLWLHPSFILSKYLESFCYSKDINQILYFFLTSLVKLSQENLQFSWSNEAYLQLVTLDHVRLDVF